MDWITGSVVFPSVELTFPLGLTPTMTRQLQIQLFLILIWHLKTLPTRLLNNYKYNYNPLLNTFFFSWKYYRFHWFRKRNLWALRLSNCLPVLGLHQPGWRLTVTLKVVDTYWGNTIKRGPTTSLGMYLAYNKRNKDFLYIFHVDLHKMLSDSLTIMQNPMWLFGGWRHKTSRQLETFQVKNRS